MNELGQVPEKPAARYMLVARVTHRRPPVCPSASGDVDGNRSRSSPQFRLVFGAFRPGSGRQRAGASQTLSSFQRLPFPNPRAPWELEHVFA